MDSAIEYAKLLEKVQNCIINIKDSNIDSTIDLIKDSSDLTSEIGIKVLTSIIFKAVSTQAKNTQLYIQFLGKLFKEEPRVKETMIEDAFASIQYDIIKVSFIGMCIEYGIISGDDVMECLETYSYYNVHSYFGVSLLYFIFAPEIYRSEELAKKYYEAVNFSKKTSSYIYNYFDLINFHQTLKEDNFKLLHKYRKQGYIDGSYQYIAIHDDVELLKNSKEKFTPIVKENTYYNTQNVYEIYSAIQSADLFALSLFYGAKKCIDYLLNECNYNLIDTFYSLNEVAIASDNIETIKFLESKGRSLDGSLQIAVSNYKKEFIDYFVNEKKMALTDAHATLGTAYTAAMKSDYLPLIIKQLENGFDPNEKTKSGQPIIFDAVMNSSICILSILFKIPGFDANIKDREQNTPLIFAAFSRQYASVHTLLMNNAVDVNAKNKKLQSALTFAAEYGDYKIAKVILDNEQSKGNPADKYGNTPLIISIQKGELAVSNLLLTYPKVKLGIMNKKGYKPIYFAAETNNLEIAKKLIERGVDINTKNKVKGDTPLHIAAFNGCIEIIKLLQKSEKFEINVKDSKGLTPLHYAIENKQMEVFKLLLANGADYNAKSDNNETPLHFAIQTCNQEYADILLALKNIDVLTKNEDDWSSLHFAANHGFLEVCKKVILMGCNVNDVTKTLRSPMHYAAQIGNLEIIKFLLEKGGETNKIDEEKRYPIHYAAESGHYDAFEFLLKQKGIDVNAKAMGKLTMLHLAAQNKHTNIVKLLLKQPGIDKTIKSEDGLTALQYAEMTKDEELINLLK